MQSVGFCRNLELDLDDAVQRALINKSAIKIAVSEKKGSRAELNAARAGRGISIDANIDLDVVDMQIHSGIQLLEVIAKSW
ncbi:MAG: hypothetical protein ACLR2G_04810 [Phascolarctobacterium faecium]